MKIYKIKLLCPMFRHKGNRHDNFISPKASLNVTTIHQERLDSVATVPTTEETLLTMTALATELETGTTFNHKPTTHYDYTQCLFCLSDAVDLETNLYHMQEVHGFTIPKLDRLLVDVETLLLCLDSLISDYAQCLYCMTRRYNSLAIKQHMMAKDHCRIDIDDPESEFRDLYGFDTDEEDVQDNQSSDSFLRIDSHSIRLPSGKILTDQRPAPRRWHRPLSDKASSPASLSNDLSSADEQLTQAPASQSLEKLNRAKRRGLAVDAQLTHLRQGDRTSLVHLSPAQQRSYLIATNKQASAAQKEQWRVEGHVQAKGNKFLMKHFQADVKGKMNGIIE